MKKKYAFFAVIIIISILIAGIYGYFVFFGASPYAPYFLSNLMVPSSQIRDFNKDDRILIVAPHPDDEVLSAGGIIQRAEAAHAKVKVLYLTYGDHNTPAFWAYRKQPLISPSEYRKMGEVRRQEAVNGTEVLGLSLKDLIFLGYPDFETLDIWEHYWNTNKAIFDMTTATSSVPYKDAFRYGAKYNSIEILDDFKTVFKDFDPTIVIYPSPFDQNPDHQSASMFTKVTLLSLNEHPYELQYIVHQWNFPKPQFYNPFSYILPPASFKNLPIEYKNFNLNDSEESKKYDALLQYKSQRAKGNKPFFLVSFVRKNEPFFNEQKSFALQNSAVYCFLPSDFLFGRLGKGFEIRNVDISLESRDNMRVSIVLSRDLDVGSLLRIYMFPYCRNTDFAQTPKFLIEIENGKQLKVEDIVEGKVINNNIKMNINGSKIDLLIPVKLIGCADEFFLHFEGGYVDLGLYKTPWQVFQLR